MIKRIVLTAISSFVITASPLFSMEREDNQKAGSFFDAQKSAQELYAIKVNAQKKQINPHEMKRIVQNSPTQVQQLIQLLNNRNDYQDIIPKTALLHGRQGVGKSMLAKAIAIESSMLFTEVKCPFIDTQTHNLDNLHAQAQAALQYTMPHVIILDEINCLTENFDQKKQPMLINALLEFFNNVHEKNNLALIIGTTNSFEKLPNIVRNLFIGNIYKVPFPTIDERKNIIQFYGNQFNVTYDNEEVATTLAQHEFSGHDIKLVMQLAKKYALARTKKLNNLSVGSSDIQAAIHDYTSIETDSYTVQLLEQKKQISTQQEAQEILKSCPQELQELVVLLKGLARGVKGIDCISHTVLLYGKPGVGKSTLAKGIALISGVVFIHVKCPQLANTYQNSGSDNLTKLIQPVLDNKNKPYVIILDEIGTVMEEHADQKHNRDIPNAFLTLFDQVAQENPSAVIIATTNSFNKLPDAIKSRFTDRVIEISQPSFEKRKDIVKLYFDQFSIKKEHTGTYNNQLIELIAKKDLPGRAIKQVIKNAKTLALYRIMTNNRANDCSTLTENQLSNIELTSSDITTAIERCENNMRLMGLQSSLWNTTLKPIFIKGAPYIIPALSLGLGVWQAYKQSQQFDKQYNLQAEQLKLGYAGLENSNQSIAIAKEGLEVSKDSLTVATDSIVSQGVYEHWSFSEPEIKSYEYNIDSKTGWKITDTVKKWSKLYLEKLSLPKNEK